MTQWDIRNKINELNALIEENMNPGQFVLNPLITKANAEIAQLQTQCGHDFGEDGLCVWCGMKGGSYED